MKLTQVQDMGGCRAVVKSMAEVEKLIAAYKTGQAKNPKTPQPLGVPRERRGNNLDRNFAIQPRIVCAVHFTHTACAKRRKNLEWPDLGAQAE